MCSDDLRRLHLCGESTDRTEEYCWSWYDPDPTDYESRFELDDRTRRPLPGRMVFRIHARIKDFEQGLFTVFRSTVAIQHIQEPGKRGLRDQPNGLLGV